MRDNKANHINSKEYENPKDTDVITIIVGRSRKIFQKSNFTLSYYCWQ